MGRTRHSKWGHSRTMTGGEKARGTLLNCTLNSTFLETIPLAFLEIGKAVCGQKECSQYKQKAVWMSDRIRRSPLPIYPYMPSVYLFPNFVAKYVKTDMSIVLHERTTLKKKNNNKKLASLLHALACTNVNHITWRQQLSHPEARKCF